MDPQIAEELDAIDATLAGEPVDPRHAELAELALLLRAERPQMSAASSRALDAKAAQRFASRPTRPRVRLWVWAPAASGVALAAAVVIVVVLGSAGAPPPQPGPPGSSGGLRGPAAASRQSRAPGVKGPSNVHPIAVGPIVPAQSSAARAGVPGPASRAGASSSGSATSAAALPQSAVAPGALTVPGNGRKLIQASQLALSTAPNQIDQVSQELFDVVGAENGSVNSSNVTQTGGLDGYASFQLSVPSPALPDAMAKLSRLPNSRVASRTDSSEDVTNQFSGASTRLADARALRTALLRQLALATTTEQIGSLKAQIHDAAASISADEAALRTLNHQIAYSQVSVTVAAAAAAIPPARGGGFTIGKAAHTAGRVLTVAAGVALIGAAGLLPVAMFAALSCWIASALRRRRREHALDAG